MLLSWSLHIAVHLIHTSLILVRRWIMMWIYIVLVFLSIDLYCLQVPWQFRYACWDRLGDGSWLICCNIWLSDLLEIRKFRRGKWAKHLHLRPKNCLATSAGDCLGSARAADRIDAVYLLGSVDSLYHAGCFQDSGGLLVETERSAHTTTAI
jgi:hypothetical protein